jgi:hypothetical protein
MIRSRNRRRTDNTMAIRKKTKIETIGNKTLHRKLKIKQDNLHEKTGEFRCSGKVIGRLSAYYAEENHRNNQVLQHQKK